MNIFNFLTMLGGLCLFLFGMSIMGQALERRAGSGLKNILGKLTGNRMAGLLTGLCVTSIIQSSSATTVMVGREYRHDRHRMDSEPCGHRQQKRLGGAAEAFVLHARSCADRNHPVSVLREG